MRLIVKVSGCILRKKEITRHLSGFLYSEYFKNLEYCIFDFYMV